MERYDDANFPGGVVVDPTPVTGGQETAIFYEGKLADTDQIYLHIGFGPYDNWQDIQELRMSKTAYGWVKTMEAPMHWERMNFCFRDSHHNWDTNNGLNWSWIIHKGRPPQSSESSGDRIKRGRFLT